MRKRYFYLAVAFYVLVSPLYAAELKVGYVNAARLLEEAPQAEVASKQLKAEFAPRENTILSLQDNITKSEEQLRRDADVMSESGRRKLERDIVSQKRELRRIQDEFREDLNFRRNEEIAKLQQLVKEIIETVGKDENYDLILFEGIAFANKRIDLTDKILGRLVNQKGRAKGSASKN